jgi:hypothetical protein
MQDLVETIELAMSKSVMKPAMEVTSLPGNNPVGSAVK